MPNYTNRTKTGATKSKSNSALLVGVIAGTRVDTAFGVNYLNKHKFTAFGVAIASTPQEQTKLQTLNRPKLTKMVSQAINKLVKKGASRILIYCNSISGAINLSLVRRQSGVKVITPLDVYKNIAKQYRVFGLIAANCQSTANIERLILSHNPRAIVIGIGNLNLVNEIEDKIPPGKIIARHNLPSLCQSLKKSNCEIIILGCTHFPYFYSQLKEKTSANLFEPSKEMIKLLLK